MYSALRCPNCGGTIAVDVKNMIIFCDTCGKAYKNPFYEPTPQTVEEQSPVSEPANEQEETSVTNETTCADNEDTTAQDESEPNMSEDNADTDVAQQEVVETPVQTVDETEDVPVDEPSVDVVKEDVVDTTDYIDDVPTDDGDDDVVVEDEKNVAEDETHASVCVSDEQNEDKKDNKSVRKHVKPSKKHIISLVKTSICLVLAVLMFAFSFCSIVGYRQYSNSAVYSGADFVGFMFCTARHWDLEDENDLAKYEKLSEKIERYEEEMEFLDTSVVVSPTGKYNYKSEYVRALAKQSRLERQLELSVDGNVTSLEIAQVTFVGLMSLVHILFTGGMMVMSAIAFVFSLINLIKNEDKKFFFERYYLLLPFGLFLSLGVLYGAVMAFGGSMTLLISSAFAARLFFESLAFALVLAERAVYIVKNKVKVRDYAFKAVAIAVALVAVGCCFAPAFYSKKVEDGDTDLDRVVRYKYVASILGEGAITEEDYEKEYASYDHDAFMGKVTYYLDRTDTSSAVEYIMLDKYGAKAGGTSTGYFFVMLAILALGGFAVAQMFDEKQSVLARKILICIATTCMFIAFICSIVFVASINGYISDIGTEYNVKYLLDGAIVCTFIMTMLAGAGEFLPEKLFRKKDGSADAFADEEDLVEEEVVVA